MFDSDPAATFGYVGEKLHQYGLAYLHVIEPRIKGNQAIENLSFEADAALEAASVGATD